MFLRSLTQALSNMATSALESITTDSSERSLSEEDIKKIIGVSGFLEELKKQDANTKAEIASFHRRIHFLKFVVNVFNMEEVKKKVIEAINFYLNQEKQENAEQLEKFNAISKEKKQIFDDISACAEVDEEKKENEDESIKIRFQNALVEYLKKREEKRYAREMEEDSPEIRAKKIEIAKTLYLNVIMRWLDSSVTGFNAKFTEADKKEALRVLEKVLFEDTKSKWYDLCLVSQDPNTINPLEEGKLYIQIKPETDTEKAALVYIAKDMSKAAVITGNQLCAEIPAPPPQKIQMSLTKETIELYKSHIFRILASKNEIPEKLAKLSEFDLSFVTEDLEKLSVLSGSKLYIHLDPSGDDFNYVTAEMDDIGKISKKELLEELINLIEQESLAPTLAALESIKPNIFSVTCRRNHTEANTPQEERDRRQVILNAFKDQFIVWRKEGHLSAIIDSKIMKFLVVLMSHYTTMDEFQQAIDKFYKEKAGLDVVDQAWTSGGKLISKAPSAISAGVSSAYSILAKRFITKNKEIAPTTDVITVEQDKELEQDPSEKFVSLKDLMKQDDFTNAYVKDLDRVIEDSDEFKKFKVAIKTDPKIKECVDGLFGQLNINDSAKLEAEIAAQATSLDGTYGLSKDQWTIVLELISTLCKLKIHDIATKNKVNGFRTLAGLINYIKKLKKSENKTGLQLHIVENANSFFPEEFKDILNNDINIPSNDMEVNTRISSIYTLITDIIEHELIDSLTAPLLYLFRMHALQAALLYFKHDPKAGIAHSWHHNKNGPPGRSVLDFIKEIFDENITFTQIADKYNTLIRRHRRDKKENPAGGLHTRSYDTFLVALLYNKGNPSGLFELLKLTSDDMARLSQRPIASPRNSDSDMYDRPATQLQVIATRLKFWLQQQTAFNLEEIRNKTDQKLDLTEYNKYVKKNPAYKKLATQAAALVQYINVTFPSFVQIKFEGEVVKMVVDEKKINAPVTSPANSPSAPKPVEAKESEEEKRLNHLCRGIVRRSNGENLKFVGELLANAKTGIQPLTPDTNTAVKKEDDVDHKEVNGTQNNIDDAHNSHKPNGLRPN